MDDSILMPEMDKAMLVIRNYVEILENKVVELGTENKDLKVELHDLHNEIGLLKKEPEKSHTPIRNQSSQQYGLELNRRKENGDKSVLEYMSIHRELVTTKIKIRKTNPKLFQDWEKSYSQSFSDYSGYSFEEHLKLDTDEIRKELNDLIEYLEENGEWT
tara:strand:- start:771 stop:1250 length:480 start_codon:yes stop_codon:yes gene_type:complete